jgi:hypothetical protein
MRKHARFGWYCHELPNYDNHKASYAAQLDGDLHSTEAPSNRHSGVMSASGQEMSSEYASEKTALALSNWNSNRRLAVKGIDLNWKNAIVMQLFTT